MYKFLLVFKLLLVFLCLQFNFLVAQDSYTTGAITQATVTYTTPKKWTLTSKVEYRTLFYKGEFGTGVEDSWRQERIIIGPMLSKRISAKGTLGFGLQGQFRWYSATAADYGYLTRIQIQYSLSQKYTKLRATHRFLFDPAIEKDKPVSYRMRYRYNLELPLNGVTLDVGEWYLKGAIENILVYQQPTINHELRMAGFICYLLNKENKVELGIDYRISHPFKSDFQHQAWLNLAWFYSIPAKSSKQ